jgi:hypothetical protein
MGGLQDVRRALLSEHELIVATGLMLVRRLTINRRDFFKSNDGLLLYNDILDALLKRSKFTSLMRWSPGWEELSGVYT